LFCFSCNEKAPQPAGEQTDSAFAGEKQQAPRLCGTPSSDRAYFMGKHRTCQPKISYAWLKNSKYSKTVHAAK
jgi:hypothetical protein